MSMYIKQEFDFIKRTKKIIQQYDKLFSENSFNFLICKKLRTRRKYEVTLLLNSFVGLLILPQQHWFDNLPSEIVTNSKWGIDESHIRFIKKGEKKSVKEVARHLRNSLAHYNFKAFENQKDEISQIKFTDYADNEKINKTFEATLPVENIRTFLNVFSSLMLKKMRE